MTTKDLFAVFVFALMNACTVPLLMATLLQGRKWQPVEGRIESVRKAQIGDGSTLIPFVRYEVGGTQYAKEVTGLSFAGGNLSQGTTCRLLINPVQPDQVMFRNRTKAIVALILVAALDFYLTKQIFCTG